MPRMRHLGIIIRKKDSIDRELEPRTEKTLIKTNKKEKWIEYGESHSFYISPVIYDGFVYHPLQH